MELGHRVKKVGKNVTDVGIVEVACGGVQPPLEGTQHRIRLSLLDGYPGRVNVVVGVELGSARRIRHLSDAHADQVINAPSVVPGEVDGVEVEQQNSLLHILEPQQFQELGLADLVLEHADRHHVGYAEFSEFSLER